MDEKQYHDVKCVRIIKDNYLTTQWLKVDDIIFNINHIVYIIKFKDRWMIKTTKGQQDITEEEYNELMEKIKEQIK